jgi:hypothetical protein
LDRGGRIIHKPLSNTCDCWDMEGRVMFTGRYGRWSKGVLTTDAFDEVYSALS